MTKKTPPPAPANRGKGRPKKPFKTERVIFWLEENQAKELAKLGNKSHFARELFSKNGFPFGEQINV